MKQFVLDKDTATLLFDAENLVTFHEARLRELREHPDADQHREAITDARVLHESALKATEALRFLLCEEGLVVPFDGDKPSDKLGNPSAAAATVNAVAAILLAGVFLGCLAFGAPKPQPTDPVTTGIPARDIPGLSSLVYYSATAATAEANSGDVISF
jgi:hypothetical protein